MIPELSEAKYWATTATLHSQVNRALVSLKDAERGSDRELIEYYKQHLNEEKESLAGSY